MLQHTKGIVLRSIKYGDSSLVTTIFTATQGVQTYLVQGVRTAKSKTNKAGMLQPASLLELVVYQRPQRSLQRIREFHPAYIYTSLQEEVVKNSVALFSAEMLLRLLPEHAILPELFDFTLQYFIQLDKMPVSDVGNFPLYFLIRCSGLLGYDIRGNYNEHTPYLNLQEGGYSAHPPAIQPPVHDADARALNTLLQAADFDVLKQTEMNAEMRYRLLDWYIAFLHQHTQHLGNIKSLGVLRAILH